MPGAESEGCQLDPRRAMSVHWGGTDIDLKRAGFWKCPQPDIDFHAQTRYTEVTLGVQSDRGEPE